MLMLCVRMVIGMWAIRSILTIHSIVWYTTIMGVLKKVENLGFGELLWGKGLVSVSLKLLHSL